MSKLHRVQKDILKQKRRSKLQRQVTIQRKIDLDKGYSQKDAFDQDTEKFLQKLALEGVKQFMNGLAEQQMLVEKSNKYV